MLTHWMALINTFLWEYIGVVLLISFGVYATIQTKGFQFKVLGQTIHEIKAFFAHKDDLDAGGIHPIKLYFTSVGGSIGLGNIVAVTAGFAVGGPGVLLWLWIASFMGMMVKYCEIFLGIKYRERNPDGSYSGGFMYVLRKAFNLPFLASFAAVLMCIYGCEVYQFSLVAETLYRTYPVDKLVVVLGLLVTTLYCSIGGIRRLANICSVLMPIFMVVYTILCVYIISVSWALLPNLLISSIKSSFTGHAALGGFVGSSLMMTIKEGVSRAVYSGDIGVGYDSIIQSETSVKDPRQQARFAIFSLFSDTFICTMSILVVMCSGVWCTDCSHNFLVTQTFSEHFPYANHFMTALLFLAGFTTIISFLTVGYKSASFISKRWGKIVYSVYVLPAFVVFSFCDNSVPMLIMSICSGILLLVNLIGITKLYKEIKF